MYTGVVSIGVVSTGVVLTGPPVVKLEPCGAGIETTTSAYSLTGPDQLATLIEYVAPSVKPVNSIDSGAPLVL